MFELLSAGYKTERGFMKKGEIYEGIIEKVEFPNKGFVWVDDQKVIVKNGIPGQKVRFMISAGDKRTCLSGVSGMRRLHVPDHEL